MPEWITPLLRVLAPIPNFGICSTRKTSLQRRDTARATAQPTTPPPIIKMFARSTIDRIDDLRLEARCWRLEVGDQCMEASAEDWVAGRWWSSVCCGSGFAFSVISLLKAFLIDF